MHNRVINLYIIHFKGAITLDIFHISSIVVLVINILFAAVVVFLERKDATSTWAWLLVLSFIPILGFVLYLLLGQNLTRYRLFQWKERAKLNIDQLVINQIHHLQEKDFPFRKPDTLEYKDFIYMHLIQNGALFTEDNEVDILIDGHQKFDTLLKDIENAKDHIHIQYYIYRSDNLGKRIRNALIKKAKEGVYVRVLYDALGSRTLRKRFFKDLIAAGGKVEVFFPSKLSPINLRLNYRNHRKLVVIDGKIGYTGGFNVGDEYLGLDKKFGYWRDTHLRIQGTAVATLQARFIMDWNEASRYHDITFVPEHFPEPEQTGHVGMQIVTSGPDAEIEHIKNGYIKMISAAKKSIIIQTPYFIPDASMLDAVRIACLSGIDVRIMIPNKPDHMFVYWATTSYIGELIKVGAKIYVYDNGFLHTKMIVVDNKIATIGSANFDVRSSRLNFEINAFIYDSNIAKQLTDAFEKDLQLSAELTEEHYKQRSLWIRFKESISRLLSPIL